MWMSTTAKLILNLWVKPKVFILPDPHVFIQKIKKKCQIILLMTLPLLLSFSSNAFFEVVPENPMEGQNIQLHYVGCDPVVPNIATNELYYLEQKGNLINFIGSYGYGLPTCPISHEYYYDLGSYPVGDYQLDVYDLLGTTPFPINTDERVPSKSIIFGVTAPVQIPFISWPAMIFLMCLLILSVRIRFLKEGKL